MAYLVTLTSQTLVIVSRYTTQKVTFNGMDYSAASDGGVIRVYGTGNVELSAGWWDLATVVDGNYSGPPFSGSLTDTDTAIYDWLGTAEESQSTYETRTRTGNPSAEARIKAGPWIGGQGHSGCRFSGTPTYISNSPYGGGRVGFAATFVEVGDTLYG